MSKYVFFWSGPYSQWFMRDMVINGVTYNCCEQFMMAEKARLFGDDETLALIMAAKTPKEQKALGRQVKGFNQAVWDQNAKLIVYRANRAKFTQHVDLTTMMLNCPTETFVEASPYDKVWGIGLMADDPRAEDPTQWQGTNWLGEVLTLVRDDIKTALAVRAI